jgi:protein phosphatase
MQVATEPLQIPDSGRANRLSVLAGAHTVQGANRSNNEDSEYVAPGGDLFIVADGMGGHAAGEIASKFAVDVVAHDLARIEFSAGNKEIEQRVREALSRAHCMIVAKTSDELTDAGAGSTVVLALLRNHRLYVAGVGDSRAYLIRNKSIKRLTTDDTYPDTLLELGKITVDEARRHRLRHCLRHCLFAALGMKDFAANAEEISVLDVYRGDRYLLASDGLTDILTDPKIEAIVSDHDDPQLAADALVRAAISEGAGDDITCIVFHVLGGDYGEGVGGNHASWWMRAVSYIRSVL